MTIHACGTPPSERGLISEIVFSFLIFFGTLNYGESLYVNYFCCLELFMHLFFITNLAEEYSLATDTATRFPYFKHQYYTRKSSFYLFSMIENLVKPRITKSRKNLDKQDKIDLEKQTLTP